MKKLSALLLAFTLALSLAACNTGVGPASDTSEPDPASAPKRIHGDKISVLFVGNSFVYTGDVPEQVKRLSEMYGIEVEFESISPGGASLSQTKAQAIHAMQNKKFDCAVFQDYGTAPYDRESFMADVKELCDEAKKTGAVPVLYSPAWVNINGRPDKESQSVLTAVYEEAAKDNGAIFVNAGDAWVYAYQRIPDISLYLYGDYHANIEGAYLTACVFCSTLFDLHIRDICEENRYCGDNAPALGQAAWEFVSYYKANGRSPEDVVTVSPGSNEKVK